MAIDLTLNWKFVYGESGNTTIDKPTDTVEGDFLLASVYAQDTNAHTPPDGSWTQITTYLQTDYGSMRHTLYWKRAGASEPANYTFGTTSTHSVSLWRITGVIGAGDPLDSGGLAYSGCTYTAPPGGGVISNGGIVTATANAAVIYGACCIVSTGFSASTLTLHPTGNRHGVSGDVQAAAGATGTKTMTANANHYSMGVLFALKPLVVENTYMPDKWWRNTEQPPAFLHKNRIVGY